MPKTNAVINMKNPSGKSITKSVTDISNDATNAEIQAFTQGIVALTNNTYDYTRKVVTTNIDSEDDPTKTTPTCKTSTTISDNMKGDSTYVAANYTGTAQIYTYNTTNIKFYIDVTSNRVNLMVPTTTTAGTYEIQLYAPATDRFNALQTTFTVTVE